MGKNINVYVEKIKIKWQAKKHRTTIKICACTLPVVQLFMTKCVVDIHDVPSKEHDDP